MAWLLSNRFHGINFWLVRDSQRFSPTVRSMLQLKHLLHTFLRCSIGNGSSASFWFNFWTDLGPLHLLFGPNPSRTLRIPISSSVADAVRDGHWNLLPARSDHAVTLQIVLSTIPVPSHTSDKDTYLWRLHTPPPPSPLRSHGIYYARDLLRWSGIKLYGSRKMFLVAHLSLGCLC